MGLTINELRERRSILEDKIAKLVMEFEMVNEIEILAITILEQDDGDMGGSTPCQIDIMLDV